MDALSQIKQIITENDEKKKKENTEDSETETSESGKAKQMSNTEDSRNQEGSKKMPKQPSSGGEVVLKGPGVDVFQALLSKIPSATPPDKDSKAKSSSHAKNLTSLTTTTLGEEETEISDENAEEIVETENQEETSEEVLNVEEDLNALFNGETLTEDFKQKAALIFETAIKNKEKQIRENLEAEFENKLQEQVEEVTNTINEQVDNYLDYVVSEWLEENKLQVENGIRLEIAESFMEGLRNLFLEHGVDVPESNINIVDELGDQIKDLEERLNSELNKNIELNETLERYKKNELIATIGEDLTAVDFDRFVQLCENVSYENEKAFTKNISTIKENYINGTNKPTVKDSSNNELLSEEITEENEDQSSQPLNEEMSEYTKVLSRFKGRV